MKTNTPLPANFVALEFKVGAYSQEAVKVLSQALMTSKDALDELYDTLQFNFCEAYSKCTISFEDLCCWIAEVEELFSNDPHNITMDDNSIFLRFINQADLGMNTTDLNYVRAAIEKIYDKVRSKVLTQGCHQPVLRVLFKAVADTAMKVGVVGNILWNAGRTLSLLADPEATDGRGWDLDGIPRADALAMLSVVIQANALAGV